METAIATLEKEIQLQKVDASSILGIAHEYANTASIEQEEGAFERAMAEKHAVD